MLTSKLVTGPTPVPITMLPFLYQTKTLSYLFSSTQAFRPHVQALPRYISTSARRARALDPDSIPVTTRSPEAPKESETVKSPSTPTWDPNAPSAGAQRILPRKLRANDTEKDFDNEFSMPTAIDFEGANTDAYRPRESTITFREKMAFQKIFTDILERTQKAHPSAMKTRLGANEKRHERNLTGTKERAKTALNDILATAMQSKSRLELEEAVNTYPPVLREDAAKAIFAGTESLSDDEREEKAKVEADELEKMEVGREALKARAEELEALRASERLRVETLMRTADSDFKLWEVMETEVFSMISRLGLAEDSKIPEPSKVNKTMKGKKKSKQQPEAERKKVDTNTKMEPPEPIVEEETEKDALDLQIYGPLYPSYLLLGLRLLDRSFAKPSPLALSILPKIKSLGFISHVLGASTQFYNDLLRIYRYRYDDFRGMIELLQEMEQSALEMDDETITIVLDVLKMQGHVSDLERGSAVKALWRMPEFAPNKFGMWKEKIAKDIAERKINATAPSY